MAGSKVTVLVDETAGNLKKGASLNFKVSPEFKKKFKGFAVARGISMTDLLIEGFSLSNNERNMVELANKVIPATINLAQRNGDCNDA